MEVSLSDAIIIEGVTKTFGEKTAVDQLDLTVGEGGMYGFIGPNGAGKTTTIRMIMSIIFPDSGRLSVLGKASAVESKDQIGYLPEERGVYRKMKVGAFLSYLGRLKGLDGGAALNKRIHDWLERVGLEAEVKKKCEELSKGMQQKVQFIACVLHEPELLILDEPFSGLDPVNMRLMRDLFVEQHERGATIIFSTHVMHQAEQLCDHIVMIDHGRKMLDDSLDAIRGRYEPRELIVEARDPGHDLISLRGIEGVGELSTHNGATIVSVRDGDDPSDVIARIAASVPARRIEVRRPTLEDVFVDIAVGESERTEAQIREELQRAGELDLAEGAES